MVLSLTTHNLKISQERQQIATQAFRVPILKLLRPAINVIVPVKLSTAAGQDLIYLQQQRFRRRRRRRRPVRAAGGGTASSHVEHVRERRRREQLERQLRHRRVLPRAVARQVKH